MVGGEITEYTKMMAEAREEAIQRMIADAEETGERLPFFHGCLSKGWTSSSK